MSEKGPVLVIVGPTAAGKSRLALECCESLNGEIVSADSVQVYRKLDIGSAKPSQEEQARVRHWCIDLVEPNATFDAAAWAQAARDAIEDIRGRGRVPVVVGGTGFYIRALFSGLHAVATVPEDVRLGVRADLEEQGPAALHAELAEVDPAAAERISTTDSQRIGRALEVFRATGAAISSHFEKSLDGTGLVPLTFGLWPSREILHAAINARAARMVEDGLVSEVRGLMAAGVPHDCGPLTSLGYRQVVGHLRDEIPETDLVGAIATAHRQYARRQLTWFRGITTREHGLEHLDPGDKGCVERLREAWLSRR